MSHTLNSVDRLGPPFSQVDEQVFVIPEGGFNEVANKFFKVVCLLDGGCWHQVDGGPKIRLEAGDVLVIPRLCLQRYWPLSSEGSERVHALRLIFDTAILPPLPNDYSAANASLPDGDDPETDLASFLRRSLSEDRHVPLAHDLAMQALLAELRKEAEDRAPGFRFRVTALCTTLVVTLARQANCTAEREMNEHRRRRVRLVAQAREYLIKNLDHRLSLAKVAGHLRVSEEHLARVFRQETGQTVFDFLGEIRLEKAKTYLLGSEMNVTEIARQTGFSSVSLFSRTFKRAVGTGPLAYRQERWTRAISNETVLKQSVPGRSESMIHGPEEAR
jgi:AraC-like DNA-binding protein